MHTEGLHILLVSQRDELRDDILFSFSESQTSIHLEQVDASQLSSRLTAADSEVFVVVVLDLSSQDEVLLHALKDCHSRINTATVVLLATADLAAKYKWLKHGATNVVGVEEISRAHWSNFLNASRNTELQRNHLLASNDVYRDAFMLSPQPMWFYDLETLRFMEVNIAAVRHYGYSREEFLSMTLRDIRPQEDQPLLDEAVNLARRKELFFFRGIFRHRKKDGTIIQVEIQTNSIYLNGRRSEVVMASDITDRLNYIDAIAQQNNQLREIAVMQSHAVRAPLSRLMAISDRLAKVEALNDEGKDLLEMLKSSAKELDDVIRQIVSKTNEQF